VSRALSAGFSETDPPGRRGEKGEGGELPEGGDAVGSGGTCQRLVGNGRVNSSGNLKRMGEHPAGLIANQL
jgi:hypothetical protein